MADVAISSLPAAEEIFSNDLFVLEQNGQAKKLLGQLLTEFVNRNILSVTVTSIGATERATSSYDPTTGALTLGLPRGSGISDIQKTATTGLSDTYTITFEAPYGGSARPPITFSVKNGDSIVNVNPIVETHTPGGFDTYEIEFAERNPIQFNVYNGANGGGSAEYDEAQEGIYLSDGGISIITNAQIDALFA